ncbi:MAG: hypothetical protein ACON32_12775 [Pirellulaceae bacterium]
MSARRRRGFPMWLLNVSVLQDIVHGHTWLGLECGGPARWVEQRGPGLAKVDLQKNRR